MLKKRGHLVFTISDGGEQVWIWTGMTWNGILVKNVATGTVFQSKCGRFSIILYLFHTSLRLFAVNFAVVTLHAKLRLSVL